LRTWTVAGAQIDDAVDEPRSSYWHNELGKQQRTQRDAFKARLVFAVSDRSCPDRPMRAIVAKLVVPAELMAELAQMIAADRPESGAAFARLPVGAVAH
jgi:hypothetical protein